jgi:dTDP-4-amino-4,6-dideoxygalactose transaminase
MMKIPVAKPFMGTEEAQAAYDTILTNWVTQGPRVQEFEEKFAAYVGSAHAVAVSNCTTALHLALLVAGIKPGDEVICPSMSYIATANAIVHAGGTPVFAEVISETYNMDPVHTEQLITPKTKAILIVHQIGLSADIDAFRAICDRHGIALIEDAACAAGSAYKGKRIGSHSDLVCFSFHPRKVITTGDGGMITTSRHRIRHTSAKVIIEEHLEIGFNYRMTDIQASVGIKQLERLDSLVAARRAIAQKYQTAFAQLDKVRLPLEPDGYFTNWQSYVLYLKPNTGLDRNALMQHFLDRGISTRRGVMISHREPAYRDFTLRSELPISEDASDRSIVLPLYVPMSDAEVDYVIEHVLELMR